MKTNKAFKLRLYPNSEQSRRLMEVGGCCRWVWNYFLAENIEKYKKEKKFLFWLDMANRLPKLKQENEWLLSTPSHSLQRYTFYLDRTLRGSFKNNRKNGFPKFKKKSSMNDSFYLPNTRFKIEKNRILLSIIGSIKFRCGELPCGKILSTTIKQDGDRWYCSVVCEVEIEDSKYIPRKAVGIDLGLKHFLVTSDGEFVENPRHLIKAERRLKIRQRSYSRSQKQSNRKQRKRLILQNTYRKVRDQRNDFLHQLSYRLIAKNGTICVEDLNVKKMQGNRYLAKSIGDVGWSEFLRLLEYKSNWYGRDFKKVERFFPTTKMCSSCGKIQEMPLNKRVYSCDCGLRIDRDLNAAINILNFGISPTPRNGESNAREEPGVSHSLNREYKSTNLWVC